MEDFSKNQLKPNAAPKLFHSNSLKPRQSADDEETKNIHKKRKEL